MDIKSFFKEWIVPIGAAAILALLITKFLFFQVKVPSKSMYPTIKPGDRITVTRVYNKSSLKTGDIVVFDSKELHETLIKRLIGCPGDTVKIDENGLVYVNGKKLEEPYVVYNGGIGGEFKVPDDKYFFMGDNRGDSLDSRYWEEKYIDASDIKGKAQFIVFPFNRLGKFKAGEQ